MKTLSRTLALGLALLLPGLALAHGKDGAHVMGTVKEVRAQALVLETKDKQQAEVMTDENTRYEKSGVQVKAADLKVGERVVVHGMKMPNGQVHAQLVKFGKQAKQSPSAAPAASPQHDSH